MDYQVEMHFGLIQNRSVSHHHLVSIYLRDRFGVRSEIDVYHTGKGAEVTGPPAQEQLVIVEV